MNKTTKVLIALFLIIAAGTIILGIINFYSVNQFLDGGHTVQEVTVRGEDSRDAFLSESESHEDHFVFTFIPRDPNETLDCYINYEFRQDENIFEIADKKLYKGVTAADPIVLEFPREEGSLYELDVVIEDTGGVTLHNSGLKIYPPVQGN